MSCKPCKYWQEGFCMLWKMPHVERCVSWTVPRLISKTFYERQS